MTKEELMEQEELTLKEEQQRLRATSQVLKLDDMVFDDIVDAIGVTEVMKLGERCVYLAKALEFYETLTQLDKEVAMMTQLENTVNQLKENKAYILTKLLDPTNGYTTEEIWKHIECLGSEEHRVNEYQKQYEEHKKTKGHLESVLALLIGGAEW